MGKTLIEIAQQLKDTNKKVQLIYAFNGSGKTRLSREFKRLIALKNSDAEGGDEPGELTQKKSSITALSRKICSTGIMIWSWMPSRS
ncbi:hypothetical protein O206_21930 [Ochrobactrum sp. EGD-AQ16]|nr:hypothetical protein O206_21930 [Ochrobactrum sp. EGD-AQ16]